MVSEEKLLMMYQLLRKETRIRDHDQVKVLLSDAEIVRTIRETFSVFCEPIIRLYKQTDVSLLLSCIRDLFRDILQHQSEVAKGGFKLEPDQKLYEKYVESLEQFMKHIYSFFHDMAKKDEGLVQSLIEWFVSQMKFFQVDDSKPELDVKSILNDHIKTDEQHQQLAQELKILAHFYEERKRRITKRVDFMMRNGEAFKCEYEGFFDRYASNEELEDINYGEDEIVDPPPCPLIASMSGAFMHHYCQTFRALQDREKK